MYRQIRLQMGVGVGGLHGYFITVCSRCGAMVHDGAVHDEWHENQKRGE